MPKALQNGDFEGSYKPLENSGVTSDRALYVPEGWTIEYSSPNENDLSALKAGDLYFDQFFGSRAKPTDHGAQTYWVRQKWGKSTITLSQELLLPAGTYTLTADLWKSGLGGDATLSIITEDGPVIKSPTLDNKTAWQQLTLDFESDGEATTTIQLIAMHNSDGSEKIIGWDNIVLTQLQGDGVKVLDRSNSRPAAIYDLGGREVSDLTSQHGVFIRDNKKVLVQKK